MIATRYSVALHILLLVASESAGDTTSARLAWSIGTNPVVVRRIAGHLARAGLISIQRGPGGATLRRPAADITLKEVWRAIHPETDPLVRVHARTNRACPIGSQVPDVLRGRLRRAEMSFLDDLGSTTLAELLASFDRSGQPRSDAAD